MILISTLSATIRTCVSSLPGTGLSPGGRAGGAMSALTLKGVTRKANKTIEQMILRMKTSFHK
jgi:hypothetical protein